MTQTVSQAVAKRDENGHTPAPATQSAALAIRPDQEFWTPKQQAALAQLGIRGATNADLAVFMHQCQRTGLDPFSRQIYMINRREKQGGEWVDKQTIQVGIEGFRVIRDRACRRDRIEVEYEDTVWYDASGGEHAVWLWDEAPVACRLVVLKDGKRFPAVLRTAAYAAKNKEGEYAAQWRTQPEHMIEKCCEAFALRRAFPHDLGGLYIPEEMTPKHEGPARASRRRSPRSIASPVEPPVDAEIVEDSPPSPSAAPAGAGTPPPDTTTGSPSPVQDGGHSPAGTTSPPGGPAGPPSQRRKASQGQVGLIHQAFKRIGFDRDDDPDERAERLAYTAQLAGLPEGTELASTNDLTAAQAKRVLDVLDPENPQPVTDRQSLIDLIHGGGEA